MFPARRTTTSPRLSRARAAAADDDGPPAVWAVAARVRGNSGYFALKAVNDANHETARTLLFELAGARRRLFTTNAVVGETHALMLSRLGAADALGWLLDIRESPGTTIVRVSQRDEQRAVEILRRYDDKTFSFTDATSFAVMERLRINQAFSFDQDFRQYGFQTPRPGLL